MTRRPFFFLPLLSTLCLHAASPASGDVRIGQLRVVRDSNTVHISMMLDLSGHKVGRNETLRLLPVLQGADRSLELPAVEIQGRKQAILRERDKHAPAPEEAYLWPASPGLRIPYSALVEFEPWMDSASLLLENSRRKCCKTLVSDAPLLLAGQALPPPAPEPEPAPAVFRPVYAFVKPDIGSEAQAKTRSVSGTAYVSFPVSRWEIMESYRDNYRELKRIHDTIEAIRDREDTQITAIHLKGYASPESSWAHNAMLAERRTLSLKYYLQERYGFPSSIFRTDYEAEDWQGLRDYVQQSTLPHRREILDIIDSGRDPDTREALIKSRYPADYRILLNDCYPSLRHSDYQVEYSLRTYTSLEEIRRVFLERPEDLSPGELATLAASHAEGSQPHGEVFRTFARLYPDHAEAQLNAAVHALMEGDRDAAERYLLRAGAGPEALNARAILAWYQGETERAERLLREAAALGLPAAVTNLQSIATHKSIQP